jgi:hypothetical protein
MYRHQLSLRSTRSASLGELRSRMAALTATSRQHLSERQDQQGRIVRARQELATVVREAAADLNSLLTFYIHSHESGYRAAELLERAPFTPYDAQKPPLSRRNRPARTG